MTKSISAQRAATTRKLNGLQLPDCFAAATVSAAVIADSKGRKRDARRIAGHVDALLKSGAL